MMPGNAAPFLSSHAQIYEQIGDSYAVLRRPDPRISKQVRSALSDAQTVCNIGAGAGSYEPLDLNVTAVEPSQRMIDQRTSAIPVVKACAEELPFDDHAFDAAMTILSIHHWEDPAKGLKEMKRISKRQVVLTFELAMIDSLWLVRDYLPEVLDLEQTRAWNVDQIANALNATTVEVVPVPHDCTDGFQAAYWRRPEMYLRADVRAAISSFAQLPESIVSRAMDRLRTDLERGEWMSRYGSLMDLDSADFGYRLIIAG